MAISFSRYIDITSGLAVGAGAVQRELIARVYTTDFQIPTGSIVEFDTAADVGSYFGLTSEEYFRALFYLAFVSKSITRANKISYARWANVDTAPQIIGAETDTTLTEFQTVTAGTFTLTLGATTYVVASVDLSLEASLADVAAAVQTAIQLEGSDPLFTGCTVAYDATNSRFNLNGGGTGVAAISIVGGGSPDLAALLGWTDTDTRLSAGADSQTITEVLTDTTALSNNFGSFAFAPALTVTADIVEAAAWNDGNNVLFQYHAQVTSANAATVSGLVSALGGTGLTLNDSTLSPAEYPEMLPMAVLAATDYTQRGATQNYMFQQDGLTPTVTTNADANLYDGLTVNYYGQTQSAGVTLSFYQRGFLTGTGTDPVNMNVFANEQWLKDFIGTNLMNLLLAKKVPANASGRGDVILVVREGVEQALLNGTISVGKTLSATQIIFITEQTGDSNAYFQVQTSGYWLDAQIVEDPPASGEFKAVYALVYSKDDAIRKVEGSHILV
jgi:hypothetical protein